VPLPPPHTLNLAPQGYVSEKLPKAFIWNLIPIVGGPKDYMRHSPTNHSSIWTEDFPTAQALGQFLTAVAKDETLYTAYHSWRQNPSEITADFRQLFPPQSQRSLSSKCMSTSAPRTLA
jgi:hypothetical protein